MSSQDITNPVFQRLVIEPSLYMSPYILAVATLGKDLG